MNTEAFAREGLPRLLEVLQASDVRELEIQQGEFAVRVHMVAPYPRHDELDDVLLPAPEHVESDDVRYVRSSLVGTFYLAREPGAPPLVSVGDRVEDSTVVGLIEALGNVTEVHAAMTGLISQVLADDGHAVEYGQPLFEVSSGD